MKKVAVILAFLSILLTSCSDNPDYQQVNSGNGGGTAASPISLPDVAANYSDIQLPAYFYTNDGSASPSSVNGIDNTPADNAITNAGATLGRVLFYDKNLSLNSTTACGSCHRAEKAFADSSPLSHGLNGNATRRNSLTLMNSRFYKRGRFFYDERATSLENQVLQPMLDHGEMNMTADLIIQRVQGESFYPALFTKAFGSSTVSTALIAKALSQFIRSMVTYSSKYDAGRAQVATMRDAFPNFTDEENHGKDLFLKPFSEGGLNCYACHTTEAFVCPNIGPINNGLDAVSTTDLGAFETYATLPQLKGAYKIPTLRNINLTGPYMHDGRYSTLTQVIDFYSTGVQNHENLSPLLKGEDGLPRRLNLSEADKSALIKFLLTLTDNTVMSDVRWADPFVNQHL